jgi:succinoglycan biosynthesis transport protein ExoP
MSEQEAQVNLVRASSQLPYEPSEGWGDTPTLEPKRNPLERPLGAVRRYKWLMLGIVALSAGAGVIAMRMVKPDYEVTAKIWVQALAGPGAESQGPIRGRELLNAFSWVELLRSFRISDAVVRKLALYVQPEKQDDSTLFRGFGTAEKGFMHGNFKLAVAKRSAKWTLTMEDSPLTENGNPGDSIGNKKMGFRWQPPADLMAKYAGQDVSFRIAIPRETSLEVLKRLVPKLPDKTNIISLTYTDPDPQLAERTLNEYVAEYVRVAKELKQEQSVELAKIVGDQLQSAENSLRDAERALESFKVNTITLPSEAGTPIPSGLEVTRDPAIASFFSKRIELDNLHQDRIALEKVIAGAGTVPYETVLQLPSVANSPGGRQLTGLFSQLYDAQAKLTSARQLFTDSYPAVKEMASGVDLLKNKTIPDLVAAQLSQVRDREAEVERRIGNATTDLQAIPQRTIEEMRLKRSVLVTEGLYATLKSRYAEAQLAAASTTADVRSMDAAVAPEKPTSNSGIKVFFMTLAFGIGLAFGVALLLDLIDKRLRYPEQVSNELGLSVDGTVPLLPKGGVQQQSAEQLTQLVESFRTLRMNMMNGSDAQVSLAISSPSPGDGKSFIASNLAMSFADAGFRTVLVDGDTRRGSLHDLFESPRGAGLTDYLAGEAHQNEIIHPTGHDKLSLIPSGRPRRQSPELLVGTALKNLVKDLRSRFDVVIFDTPPLAAGIDGYAIASAAGSLLVVLRVGQTERRMAAAKMLLVRRLPINLMGAVLNGVPSSGEYGYYGYVDGYAAVDEQLTAGQQVAEV